MKHSDSFRKKNIYLTCLIHIIVFIKYFFRKEKLPTKLKLHCYLYQ
mgnify:CR=1 FL=1